MSQLCLNLKLDDHAVFESFLPAGNEAAVAALKALATNPEAHGVWIWGTPASGKTHLLQAACELAGDTAMYLPLRSRLVASGPELLDGLEQRAVLCLDDLDRIAGDRVWERALFRLYNALEERRHCLVVATGLPPRQSAFVLPDLSSRLRRLAVYRLRVLSGEDCTAALRLRAQHRGIELPDGTVRFLLRRTRRDVQSLYDTLDRLAAAALRQQRRLTVPFVRRVFEEGGGGF